jgi:serine/threonine protein phosphatase PrpC
LFSAPGGLVYAGLASSTNAMQTLPTNQRINDHDRIQYTAS